MSLNVGNRVALLCTLHRKMTNEHRRTLRRGLIKEATFSHCVCFWLPLFDTSVTRVKSNIERYTFFFLLIPWRPVGHCSTRSSSPALRDMAISAMAQPNHRQTDDDDDDVLRGQRLED